MTTNESTTQTSHYGESVNSEGKSQDPAVAVALALKARSHLWTYDESSTSTGEDRLNPKVLRIDDGSRVLYGHLYRQYSGFVKSTLRWMRFRDDQIDDVASEVWLAVIQRLRSFDPEKATDFKSWLMPVCRSVGIDYFRSEQLWSSRHITGYEFGEGDDSDGELGIEDVFSGGGPAHGPAFADPAELAEAQEMLERIADMAEAEADGEELMALLIGESSYAEVSERLGVKAATLRKRVERFRDRVRTELETNNENMGAQQT